MDEEYDDEERVFSILRGREGCREEFSSLSEFKQRSNDGALAEEELVVGWVLWKENEIYEYEPHQQQLLQHKIITLLKHIASEWCVGRYNYHCLVQFWAVVKEEGRPHCLSTSNYPFCVPNLKKGLSWYRKACNDQLYKVDMEGEDEEEEQLRGGVGRAYRNQRPESTPDLRLYSTNEFPLRDEAARCGFRGYMALPLLDLHAKECYGVIELLSCDAIMDRENIHSLLDQGLQIAGLRSTHIMSCSPTRHTLDNYEQPYIEITEILELAIRSVPQLSLAQVWIPCKQSCPNMSSTNSCCMEMASYIDAENMTVSSQSSNLYEEIIDCDICCYLQACKFHNLQIGLTCSFRNISDLSISKNPLAHYAKRARLSHCLTICLKSMNNTDDSFVIIEFFLQLKVREDACGDSSLHSLLRIIEMKLKIFKLVSIEQLPEELIVQSRQPNATECEFADMYNVMNSYKGIISELDFATYLASCCLQPSSHDSDKGWVYRSPAGENNVHSNYLFVSSLIKEKIEKFMKKIAVRLREKYWIIQFWTPKMVEDRYCLETLNQPYVVGSLAKGLALFRKKSMKHRYFVDEEAKEEELGPPGHVFRNRHPEITPRLYLYSTKEFPMRNYSLHYQLRQYFALPVFDIELDHKCVGVLEFMGTFYDNSYAKDIAEAFMEVNLRSSRTDLCPRFRNGDIPAANITQALNEIKVAFSLIDKIPQLHLAKVWVPYEIHGSTSISSNVRYMELALTSDYMWEERFRDILGGINYVHPKKGMIGMLLESENKSCFCSNLSEFNIADQPLAHSEREERLDVCFAICLQSSHTGDLLYVLEFFLNQSLDHLHSFFNFLLPIMKQQLQSFKYYSGRQIGEELVVEVIEFYEANSLAFSELGQMDVFPFKFKSVQSGRTEHQQAEDESEHCGSDARQTEQCNSTVVSDFITNRGKRKTGFHLSLEDLTPHFGKKLEDVAEELGVGRSTIKRACREYGIDRWPSNEKQARNPSLFERESAQDLQQGMPPSSSTSLQVQETSLHQNMTRTNTKSTQHDVIVQEEAEKVMIRVKYEEDTIKFELCLSLGLRKIFEEVVRRLNLEMGSFQLKYVDEDNEEILIACDDDLQLCAKIQTAAGKSCVQMFVHLNSYRSFYNESA